MKNNLRKQKPKKNLSKSTDKIKSNPNSNLTRTRLKYKTKKLDNSKEKQNKVIENIEPIVISKPPSDDRSLRKSWKIKPINNEGILVPNPKQLATKSGVLITDYIIGYGSEPIDGSTVKITYEGMFPNGQIFDSNLKRSKPLIFRKGINQVVRGLDLGLEGMRIGGSREIVVPAVLGYGEEGFATIPPNQTLVFRVTLLE